MVGIISLPYKRIKALIECDWIIFTKMYFMTIYHESCVWIILNKDFLKIEKFILLNFEKFLQL